MRGWNGKGRDTNLVKVLLEIRGAVKGKRKYTRQSSVRRSPACERERIRDAKSREEEIAKLLSLGESIQSRDDFETESTISRPYVLNDTVTETRVSRVADDAVTATASCQEHLSRRITNALLGTVTLCANPDRARPGYHDATRV